MTLATPREAAARRREWFLSRDRDAVPLLHQLREPQGQELAANPHAPWCFMGAKSTQVACTDVLEAYAPESDALFATRRLEHCGIGSQQARDPVAFRARKPATGKSRPGIPMTAAASINWGGYCVHPDEIEFWQQGRTAAWTACVFARVASWILDACSP